MAFAFLTSPEFRVDQITAYYNVLLHRAPDAGGLSFWVSSGLDIDSVRIGIESSPEFFANGQATLHEVGLIQSKSRASAGAGSPANFRQPAP